MTNHAIHQQPALIQPSPRGVMVLAAAAAVSLCSVVGFATVDAGGPAKSTPSVVGNGPNAVYVGDAPRVGGDPAVGETEDSYHARTGQNLPGLSNPAVVDGSW